MIGFDPEVRAGRFAVAGAGLIVIGTALARWWSAGLVVTGLILLNISCWSRRDGFLLLGPFVVRDLIIASRRRRIYLWRTITVALGGIGLIVALIIRSNQESATDVQKSGIALIFATGYLMTLIVLPLTVQSMQRSIAGEREARRLDFLLVTDLRNREIIFGRSAARVILSLAGIFGLLPYAAVISPLFGLPIKIVLIPLAYFLLMVLSLGGLAMLASTTSATVKKANPRNALITVPLFTLTCGIELLRFAPAVWGAMIELPWIGRIFVGDCLEYISAINPIAIFLRVMSGLIGGIDPFEIAEDWLAIFAAYQLAIFFAAVFHSIRVLRTVSAKLAGEAPVGATATGGRQVEKPAVSDRPILWKERHFHELLPRTTAARRTTRILGWLLAYVPALLILAVGISRDPVASTIASNILRPVLPLLIWVMSLTSIRISSGVIARERERDTLTSLLVTPISPAEIIREKWLGSLYAARGGIIWLMLIGIPASVTGLYPWWTFVNLLLLAVTLTLACISLGVLGSIGATKTDKATQSAMYRGLLVIGLQAATAGAIGALALPGVNLWPAAKYVALALFPLANLILALVLDGTTPPDVLELTAANLAGSATYLILAVLVLRRAIRKFEGLVANGQVDGRPPVVP